MQNVIEATIVNQTVTTTTKENTMSKEQKLLLTMQASKWTMRVAPVLATIEVNSVRVAAKAADHALTFSGNVTRSISDILLDGGARMGAIANLATVGYEQHVTAAALEASPIQGRVYADETVEVLKRNSAAELAQVRYERDCARVEAAAKRLAELKARR